MCTTDHPLEARLSHVEGQVKQLRDWLLEMEHRLNMAQVPFLEKPQEPKPGETKLEQQRREHRGLFAKPAAPFGTIEVEVEPLPNRHEIHDAQGAD